MQIFQLQHGCLVVTGQNSSLNEREGGVFLAVWLDRLWCKKVRSAVTWAYNSCAFGTEKMIYSLVIMTTERKEKSLQNAVAVDNVSVFPTHTFAQICSVAVMMVADIQRVCASC